MNDETTLKKAVDRIVATVQPSRVILFGSRGRGDAGEDSDFDLLVTKPHVDNQGEEMIRLSRALGRVGANIDLLVYSDTEYERRSQVPGTLLYWARKEGRPLYEASH